MPQRDSGGLYPTYTLDVSDMVGANDPQRQKWRQEMANQWSDALSKRVMSMGSSASPDDVLAILTIALTDALAPACVSEPEEYDAVARRAVAAILGRLILIRPGIEAAMARQYMLLRPEGPEGHQ